ncbi:MAG: hypothetical protein Q8P32_03010 [Candidatus Komeilibacteria bacterium]|nr:hypothetical protein [Candidatus Komeilibacteria bacterium]
MKVFKQKISPMLAFAFVLVFGYFSIFLMNQVFTGFASDEVLAQVAQIKDSQGVR